MLSVLIVNAAENQFINLVLIRLRESVRHVNAICSIISVLWKKFRRPRLKILKKFPVSAKKQRKKFITTSIVEKTELLYFLTSYFVNLTEGDYRV